MPENPIPEDTPEDPMPPVAPPQPPTPAVPVPLGSGLRIIRSEDLLQGNREVWIEHGQEMYRLRVTASGKLYLTK